MVNYKEAKTDEERYHAMAYVPYTEWQITSKWNNYDKKRRNNTSSRRNVLRFRK